MMIDAPSYIESYEQTEMLVNGCAEGLNKRRRRYRCTCSSPFKILERVCGAVNGSYIAN